MDRNDLLTIIWSGKVKVRSSSDRSPLATLLDGILSVPTVSLIATTGIKRPTAFADSAELMPGLQLGDVLAEELGFDIPINCVILLEPETSAEAATLSATDLGRDLGRVLTSVAKDTLSKRSTRYGDMFDETPDGLIASQSGYQAANP